MELKSLSAWEVLAIVAAAWSVSSLAGAAARSLRPRPINLGGQFLASVLGIIALGGAVVVMDLSLNATTAAFAFGFGFAVGLGASALAGYKDDAGEAVVRGSAWHLLPWAVSAAGMVWGGLDGNADGLALGLLGMMASTGVGAGQLVVSARAVRMVLRDWDNRPLPEGIDIVAAMSAQPSSPAGASETCPLGHELPRAGLRFCPQCGQAVRCPQGHVVTSAAAEFCVECGSRLHEVTPQSVAS